MAILNAPTIEEMSDIVKVNQYDGTVCYKKSTYHTIGYSFLLIT